MPRSVYFGGDEIIVLTLRWLQAQQVSHVFVLGNLEVYGTQASATFARIAPQFNIRVAGRQSVAETLQDVSLAMLTVAYTAATVGVAFVNPGALDVLVQATAARPELTVRCLFKLQETNCNRFRSSPGHSLAQPPFIVNVLFFHRYRCRVALSIVQGFSWITPTLLTPLTLPRSIFNNATLMRSFTGVEGFGFLVNMTHPEYLAARTTFFNLSAAFRQRGVFPHAAAFAMDSTVVAIRAFERIFAGTCLFFFVPCAGA